MGSIRRVIWKCIWLCSFCTLQITVIYRDGLRLSFENHWKRKKIKPAFENEFRSDPDPQFKDRVKQGLSPSTIVEDWDCRK